MVIGNRPEIALSFFAPGARWRASSPTSSPRRPRSYVQVLVEIGLVLLAVTMLVNIFARLLVWRVGAAGAGH